MKENKYDDEIFFEKYSAMPRSAEGLRGAGEWHILKGMLPDFQGKRVLDLGCGFGWHCKYAADNGASYVLGTDISEKMIEKARRINDSPAVEYDVVSIEDYTYPESEFDIVISSLAFHYVASFGDVAAKIFRTLRPGGVFVFSVEHPVFTAYGTQDWIYDAAGQPLHWPVDRYFSEGVRDAVFLGEKVTKYHKTLTTYINTLLKSGFRIDEVVEPEPSQEALESYAGMKDELRRPIFLIVSAHKAQ